MAIGYKEEHPSLHEYIYLACSQSSLITLIIINIIIYKTATDTNKSFVDRQEINVDTSTIILLGIIMYHKFMLMGNRLTACQACSGR